MPKKKRFRAYVAAYLCLIENGKILLLRRSNTGYQDGNYSLIAGHLDGKETSKQCIVREAYEETSITLEPSELEVVHVMHRLAPDREYIDIYIRTKKYFGDIKIMEPDKCDEFKWSKLDSLPKNMTPEVKFALKNISKNIHYSDFGW